MTKNTDFAYALHRYFTDYLQNIRKASQNTTSAYSYTFSLLLKFLGEQKRINPQKVKLSQFDRALIIEFLEWLEKVRNNSISTLNQRLGSIHSFCHFIAYEYPEHLLNIQQILAIPIKKSPKPMLNYLSHDGIKLLFEIPNIHTKQGRRDLMLLTLLYDVGLRASELCSVTIGDLSLQNPASIRILGKGEKYRQIPLMAQTVKQLKGYIDENCKSHYHDTSIYLFTNPSGRKLTRSGVAYILKKYCDLAREKNPELIPDTFSPHCLRHSKAMHLLQSGVNLIYIRDFLGHADIATTEIYAKTDPQMKRNALEKAYIELSPEILPNWKADVELMGFLKALSKTQ